MKKENFTAERISGFNCKAGRNQSIFWDAKTPGLGLRVTISGAKSYIFESKLHGKTIRTTIGDIRTWSVGKAQKEATDLKSMVDKGTDPRKQRADQKAQADAEQQAEERKEALFKDVWTAYMVARKPKWSARHYSDHEKAISSNGTPAPLADLKDLKLSEITPDRVKEWLDKNTPKRPTSTAICFRKLRAFLNWAEDQSEYAGTASPDACSKKVATYRVAKNKSKDDCLQREQLKPWFEEIDKLSSPIISAYLKSLLLTGARREEMAALMWVNVDLKWKSLVIKDKVDGERTIPLTPYVESLLRELKAANDTPPPEFRILHGKKIRNDLKTWKPSPWVFSSGTSESGRIVEPRIGHNRALAAAGLPALSLHGLRRSFGTLAEWVECPVGISAQIMGHKPSALAEKHYRVRPLDLLRKWHTKIEGWILAEAGIAQPKLEADAPALKSVA